MKFRGLCGIFDGDKANDFHDKDAGIFESNMEIGQIEKFPEHWRIDSGQSFFEFPPELMTGGRRSDKMEFCVCQTNNNIGSDDKLGLSREHGDNVDTCAHTGTRSLLLDLRHYVDITPVLALDQDNNDKYVNDQAEAGGDPSDNDEPITPRVVIHKLEPDGLNIHWTMEDEHQYRHKRGANTEDVISPSMSNLSPEIQPIIVTYPTLSGLTEDNVYSTCSNTVHNSSIAAECQQYLSQQVYSHMNLQFYHVINSSSGPVYCPGHLHAGRGHHGRPQLVPVQPGPGGDDVPAGGGQDGPGPTPQPGHRPQLS